MWGLCEGIRSWWGVVMNGTSAFIKRNRHDLSRGHVKIKQEDIHLQNTERVLTKIEPYWHFDLGFPTFRTVRNNFYCFRQPVYRICYSSSNWLEQYLLSSFTCTTKAAFLHIPSNIQLQQSSNLIRIYSVLILPSAHHSFSLSTSDIHNSPYFV